MALSVFDMFTVGVGPSSSHTVGPMRAGRMFIEDLGGLCSEISHLTCTLHGSLGSTGKGHGSDYAVVMGLMGETPEEINPLNIRATMNEIAKQKKLTLAGGHTIDFEPVRDVEFDGLHELPRHPNGLTLTAYDSEGALLSSHNYYSIGGGFVIRDGEPDSEQDTMDDRAIPFPFDTAEQLLAICRETGYSVAKVMLENEKAMRSEEEIVSGLLRIWHAMNACIDEGMRHEGMLPGSLHVPRRAPSFYRKLVVEGQNNDPLRVMDWIELYAMSVNEENAAGGRVVTAPTNGAAGVIPAVLRYFMDFVPGASDGEVVRFLLTAGAIGMIFKRNASISGAEVGCQGEVGSACSMAAGALAAVMGGTPLQVENAAEIGMEHNLGLTCDPVGGYVQVPCIERNGIAAIKAVAAARTALHGDGTHIVSLDEVIKTMRDTGLDMQSKYKETSLGGLAVNVTEC